MKKFFCYLFLIGIAVHPLHATPLNVVQFELRERVYVQTDKQLYLSGEPILLKFVTTDPENIPLVFSKVAYAELVDNSVSRIQIMVELHNGTGAGRMQLPADLPTGYYRLVAYTQFMRNEGADVFFEKNIAVMNTFQLENYPDEEVQHAGDVELSGRPHISNAIDLRTDNAIYPTRTRGELILDGLPENIHTLSVTIAGKEFLPVAGSGAALFEKNRTKNPDSNATASQRMEFLPEYEGHIITGKIVDNQTGTHLADSQTDDILMVTGLAFPGEGIRFFPGQKSEPGSVRFYTSGISGMKEIATTVYHVDEKYRVDIQSPFINRYSPKPMPALLIDSAYYGQLLDRSVALQVFHYFSEASSVNISHPHFNMKPTYTYLMDEYTRFTTMREVFIEFITGARFRSNAGKQEISVLTRRGRNLVYGNMPLVLLDGVPVSNHDAIYNYDPLTVEKINIYYGPRILGGYQFDGIVELTTYRRNHADLNLNRSAQIFTYETPQPSFLLDTPDYSEEKNRQSRIPDGRHTLVWNPDVRIDSKTSIQLPFDTSDLTGEFQATVEGITSDGQFIYATSFFMVE